MMPTTADRARTHPRYPASPAWAAAGFLALLSACSGPSGAGSTAPPATATATADAPAPAAPSESTGKRPVTLTPMVDLARYSGDWYVIGAIPTSFEDEAYNSKESYRLDAEGRMVTTFSFNQGSYTGPLKSYTSTGYILDKKTNAVWGQQYIWPIKADYRITYLSPDYRQVVVTRDKRDYAWIMARTPTIADADYQRLSAIVAREGYDTGKLRKMPQASGR